jgi:endoplasmic reticulum resident protein 44
LKVDADQEKIIAANNGINKYPTLKMYRFGVLVKKEYRGARNVQAFEEYLQDQLVSKLKIVETRPEYLLIDTSKPTVIGMFQSRDAPGFKAFEKMAALLRDKADFIAGVG